MSNTNDKKVLSRRQAITQTSLGLAASVTILDMYKNMLPLEVRKAIELGSNEALGQSVKGRKNPIIQICLIDKTQQPLFIETPGAVEAFNNGGTLLGLNGVITPMNMGTGAAEVTTMYKGVSLKDAALNFVNFRGRADMSLTRLFGDPLAEMAPGYNMAIIPKTNSRAGGHDLTFSGVDLIEGGLNNYIQSAGSDPGNLLGFVGFSFQANANNSRESARGLNGVPLPTYDGPMGLRDTLKNSVAPLTASEKSLAFRKKLDALAVKNSGVLKTLLQIKDRIDPAVQSLGVALSGTKDIVERQFEAIVAMHKAGLANNFMLAIPWTDTNGGNSLTNTGGDAGFSPINAAAALANLYVRISKELPDAITVTVSDGGRSNTNGDAAGGLAIITGPSALVSDGVFGNRAVVGNLGGNGDPANGVPALANNGSMYTMTAGSALGILEFKNLLSLVLKMVDIKSDMPAPVGISPKVG